MKKILMIALDFPPCQTAGVQRTLKFVEYLPDNDWQPIVLTAMPFIYDTLSAQTCPNNVPVYRAFGLNTLKHLAIKGRHLALMTKPDRFFTWFYHGAMLGKKIIEEHKPDVIWSTFPYSTAMRIGLSLKRHSGLPWVADFRDPFAGVNPMLNVDNYPASQIDRHVVENADHCIFATDNMRQLYQAAYPTLPDSRMSVITNGYNETQFAKAEASVAQSPSKSGFLMIHSGVVYPNERNPINLLKAVAQLRDAGELPEGFHLMFRGGQPTDDVSGFIQAQKLDALVSFTGLISYEKSIEEMLRASALIILQGKVFNNQIPGKAYEYLRTGRPILAISDHQSATSRLLEGQGGTYIADIDNTQDIARQMSQLFAQINNTYVRDIHRYSREATAQQLADVLSKVS